MISKVLKIFSIIIMITMIVVSCSPRTGKKTNDNNFVIFPPPPDTTRIQYLKSISTSSDVGGKRSAFATYVLGEENEKTIIKPYGMAIFKGRLYICDTMLGGLEIIDLENKEFEYFRPSGFGQLKKPINCSVDKEGFLYVADAERRQIVVFDSLGSYFGSIGGEEMIKPTDVKIYNGKIWVSDIKAHKVFVYAKDGFKKLSAIPDFPPKTPGFLFSPTNLDVVNDRVYVSDFGDFKIKIYTTSGEFIGSVGSYGKALGQFVRPKGIAIDKDLNLFVVDAGFENVQIFDAENNLLMFFGGNYKGPGGMWLPAKVILDYDNLKYFQKYVDKSLELKYLIFVSNQYGPDKINVYGFVKPKRK